MVRRRITLVLLSALIAGTLSAASADTLVEPLTIEKRLIHARDPLPENPCFRPYAEQRQINVIVLHHSSAVYWFDPAFQALLTQEVKDRVHAQGITPENIQTHRFDLDLIIQIFRTYGVAPHYLIGRQGEVIQLVEDNDMAYHAGVSTMPDGDGRTGVNYFSIGIELTSVHPDDERIGTLREPAYTEAQYLALTKLVERLTTRYSIKKIVGHDEIAPDRKKDPGPLFDWSRIRDKSKSPMPTETPLPGAVEQNRSTPDLRPACRTGSGRYMVTIGA